MPTKDELLFENQSLKEDQEILLKRAREAEQTGEQMQSEIELLRAGIEEAQAEKEQAEALAEQLRQRLSQSPQPEEVALLKEWLSKASQALVRQKTLEGRMARMEATLERHMLLGERDRQELKETLTLVVENQIILSSAIRAPRPDRSLPPPQEKIVTPPPYQVRRVQSKVKERELTIQEINAVAERALTWANGESLMERQQRLEREMALMKEKSHRYREIFLNAVMAIIILGLTVNYLVGWRKLLIMASLAGAAILCGLSRKLFRSLVRLAKEWDQESRPVWAFATASIRGTILSLLIWLTLLLLTYWKSLAKWDSSLPVLALWGLMILYALSGAWTKSLCKAIYSTLT